MTHITPWSEFTLKWQIRFNDYQLEMGELPFVQKIDETSLVGDESDEMITDGLIGPINMPANFKSVILPIMVNEMQLWDECASLDLNMEGLCPPYEEATFTLHINNQLTHGGIGFSWGLKGCGFGQFYLSCCGGIPHLSNEMMGKGSILEIFKHL